MNWFIRQLIRRNFRPLPEQIAQTWNKRLKFVYLFCTWNAVFLIGYHFYGILPKDQKKDYSAEAWASYFKISEAKIVKIRGISEIRFSDFTFKEEDKVVPENENADCKTQTSKTVTDDQKPADK